MKIAPRLPDEKEVFWKKSVNDRLANIAKKYPKNGYILVQKMLRID